MIARALGIAGTTLRGATRSTFARAGMFLLLIAVPLAVLVFGQDEQGRVIVARMVTVEGLRLLLPLAAVVGGAFVLRPGLRAGYALLPATRGEWFLGATLAGLCMTALSVALFVTGAMLAGATLGEPAKLVRPQLAQSALAGAIEGEVTPGGPYLWANPTLGQTILLTFPAVGDETVSGEVSYEEIWDHSAPPERGLSFNVFVYGQTPRGTTPYAEATMLARKRAAFVAPRPGNGPVHVELVPRDQSLTLGVRPADVFLRASLESAAPSLLRLALAAFSAAVLCMTFTLLVRSRGGASTAALAGLLLLATLTLLPDLTPAAQMAADRRKAVEGQDGASIDFGRTLSNLPELVPNAEFDTFIAGRTVGAGVLVDASWRAGVALLLLPVGAMFFRRRQIAK